MKDEPKMTKELMEEFLQFLSPPTIVTRKHTDGSWCEDIETCQREHVLRQEELSAVLSGTKEPASDE